MTKIIAIVFTVLIMGCSNAPESEITRDPKWVDRPAPFAYEDGLRAGHSDAKQYGYCDHPFPREEMLGYGPLYLSRFETGYFKGCALARKSTVAVPKKKPSQVSRPRTRAPVASRCEA